MVRKYRKMRRERRRYRKCMRKEDIKLVEEEGVEGSEEKEDEIENEVREKDKLKMVAIKTSKRAAALDS